jgi:hypothetical protein
MSAGLAEVIDELDLPPGVFNLVSGIGAAGAEEEVLALAERLALPVAIGGFDYGSFPVQHPNYAGTVESISEEPYDVVCCVGYRQSTRGYPSDLRFAAAGLARLARSARAVVAALLAEAFDANFTLLGTMTVVVTLRVFRPACGRGEGEGGGENQPAQTAKNGTGT